MDLKRNLTLRDQYNCWNARGQEAKDTKISLHPDTQQGTSDKANLPGSRLPRTRKCKKTKGHRGTELRMTELNMQPEYLE